MKMWNTADLKRMNPLCVLSLVNQVSQPSSRRLALYGFISTTGHLRNEFLETEALLIASILLVVKVEYIYRNTNKMQKTTEISSTIKRLEDV